MERFVVIAPQKRRPKKIAEEVKEETPETESESNP
jgi:hypothetical protein